MCAEIVETNMARAPARHSHTAHLTVSLVLVSFVLVLRPSHGSAFRPYFGGLDPAVAILVAVAVGTACLVVLQRRGWFAIRHAGKVREALVPTAVSATVLALITIGVDLLGGFPGDINVGLPLGLLFYPVMGYVVEVAFHLLPLTVLLLIATRFSHERRRKLAVGASLVLVAATEPAFQVATSSVSAHWVSVYLGVHLFVFGAVQLSLFARFGFLTMYLLRLVYYAYWHVLWGYARLQMPV